jgi:hypothetical protein
MGTGSASAGVKRSGLGVDQILPTSAEVKERVQLCLYSTFRPSWPVYSEVYFYINPVYCTIN